MITFDEKLIMPGEEIKNLEKKDLIVFTPGFPNKMIGIRESNAILREMKKGLIGQYYGKWVYLKEAYDSYLRMEGRVDVDVKALVNELESYDGARIPMRSDVSIPHDIVQEVEEDIKVFGKGYIQINENGEMKRLYPGHVSIHMPTPIPMPKEKGK